MSRITRALSVTMIAAAVGCGSPPSDAERFADACTTFCENSFDCFDDPDPRRANCRSACSTPPIPGACEDAAVTWAECLAALTCDQLHEVGAPEAYCGAQHATYEAACTMTADGGAG